MLSIQTAPIGPAHHVFLMALVASLILATLVVLRIQAGRLRSALLPKRPGHTEDSFVHHLASIGLNPRIARTTYRYLQQTRRIRFPILAKDALQQELGLDRRAITETIQALMLENDRALVSQYQRSAIVTVGDLVAFIQASPRAEFDLAA